MEKGISLAVTVLFLAMILGVGLLFYYKDRFHFSGHGGFILIDDMTEDESAWFGYHNKAIYQLQRDVFLIRVDWGLDPERLALTPDSSLNQVMGLYIAPTTIEAYEKDPESSKIRTFRGQRYYIDVAGIVRAGTKIRCDRLLLNTAYNWWFGKQTDYTVYATILNGAFAGNLVDIDDISTFCDVTRTGCNSRDARGRIRRTPDERILKNVS